MSRLPDMQIDGATAQRIRRRRGDGLHAIDLMLLHSPPIADGWNALLGAVRDRSTLAPDVREAVVLRIAVLNRAPYEWDAHVRPARSAGLSDAQLGAIRQSEIGGDLTEEQRLALAYTDAITTDLDVSDDLFAAVRTTFDDQQVVELTVTAAAYNMVSRFLVALQVTEASGDSAPAAQGAR